MLALDLCLESSPNEVLQASQIIRADLGLAVAVLRHATDLNDPIQATVASLGHRLPSVLKDVKLLSDTYVHPHRRTALAVFSRTAQLAGQTAETMASNDTGIAGPLAYLAGLFSDLPAVFVLLQCLWCEADRPVECPPAEAILRAWQIPEKLSFIIGAQNSPYAPLARAAHAWASLQMKARPTA